MKVQCDVCAADAASVFCCADEAALCEACDRRVHRANKLAGKHRRFSLLSPSPPASSASPPPPPPLCDICQEKRGFLFCKEDRAILCRECDVPVHAVSDLTMRHTRFLLTGVRISSEPAASPAPPDQEEEENNSVGCCSGDNAATSHGCGSSSSISEYLTKTLPGWHVEDFLVDDATAAAAASSPSSTGISAHGSYSHQGETWDSSGMHGAGYPSWMAQERPFCESVDVVASGTLAMADRERWVPQMYAEPAGSKRSRTSAAYPYW